jgi:hypothetical protein
VQLIALGPGEGHHGPGFRECRQDRLGPEVRHRDLGLGTWDLGLGTEGGLFGGPAGFCFGTPPAWVCWRAGRLFLALVAVGGLSRDIANPRCQPKTRQVLTLRTGNAEFRTPQGRCVAPPFVHVASSRMLCCGHFRQINSPSTYQEARLWIEHDDT